MHRKILMGAISAAVLAFATSASAVVWTSKLEYQGTSGPAATPYGLVTIEDGLYGQGSNLSGPANTVKVTVSLTNPNSLFINTGSSDPTKSNHDPFLFNVKNPAEVNVVNDMNGRDFMDGGRTDPASFLAVPFGNFTNKIAIGDWTPDQQVVSGFHMVDQVVTESVVVGYEIKGYEQKIIGYEVKGYEQKLIGYQVKGYEQKIIGYKQNGNPIYGDDLTKPIYNMNKPIYADDLTKPIYNTNKPIYADDLTKPIYNHNKPIYQDQQVTKQVKVLDYATVAGHYVESTQNGNPGGIPGDLVFYLTDNAGLSFAGLNFNFDPDTGQLLYPLGDGNHLFSNSAGWWFSADIYDGATGTTYNVAAKDAFCTECVVERSVGAVPEPATWAMMILGFGATGALLRRRRRLLAA